MRGIFRVLGVVVSLFFIVVFSTFTVKFIKHNWFGSKPGASKATSGTKSVAVVDLNGVIYNASSFLKRVKEIKEDDNVKAVVVRVNSPGGVVGPSQEMYEALKKLDAKMPVVVSMGSVAASGGYYAALGGRKIYANPGTMTASIGVIMEFANTSELYRWAKVERYQLTAGKMKAAGSDTRPMKPEERQLFETMLSDIHGQFKAAVQERRKGMTPEEVERWTDGRVMTGQQAKVAKLVDALGGYEDALADARKLAGLPEDAPIELPESKDGLLKKLLFGEDDEAESLAPILEGVRAQMAGFRDGWRVMLLAPIL